MLKNLRNWVAGASGLGRRRAAGAALAGVLAAGGLLAPIAGVTLPAAASVAAADDAPDQLVMRDGRVLNGKILEETETQIRFKLHSAVSKVELTYDKSRILAIKRGVNASGEGAEAEPAPQTPKTEPAFRPRQAESGEKPVVYVVNLKGWIGQEVTATPLREVMTDARRRNPDVLVFVLDNTWEDYFGEEFPEDQVHAFDQLFAVEEFDPILTREVELTWEKQPRRVAWVKQAMGGGAFVPFLFPEIYFHPDGRMGGIGSLSTQFTQGDRRAIEKQISLRLGHAEGMAISGGYEPKLIRAMAMMEYELSYSLDGGRPVYHERVAKNPGEFTLTDNGFENPDSLDARVRGESNDVLTLKADTARNLGVSRGTVRTLDDLLFELGLRDAEVIEGPADRILTRWADGVRQSSKDIPRLMREFQEIALQGDAREIRRALGLRRGKLRELERILRRYHEALPYAANLEAWIARMEEQIRLMQMQL